MRQVLKKDEDNRRRGKRIKRNKDGKIISRRKKPTFDHALADRLVRRYGFFGFEADGDAGGDAGDDLNFSKANPPTTCLTQQCRDRRKEFKRLRDEYKSSHTNREWRKKGSKWATDKAFKKYPKLSAKEVAQSVAHDIAKASLAPFRGAFLGLIGINYRGLATKIFYSTEAGKKKIYAKWYKMGGNPEKLKEKLEKNSSKKPHICGKKCKEEVTNINRTSSFSFGGNEHLLGVVSEINASEEYHNVVTAAAVGAWVSAAGVVLSAIKPLITPSPEGKNADDEIKADNDGVIPPDVDVPVADPKDVIDANPNLSAAEKSAAKSEVDAIVGGKLPKTLIFAGLGIIVLGVLYKFVLKR